MDKMTEELNSRRNYFDIDDGHEMKMMPAMRPGNRGSSGANHTGTPEDRQGSHLKDESGKPKQTVESAGIGAFPMKTVGSMADDAYGADLGPDAINRIARFDADSDDGSLHRFMPPQAKNLAGGGGNNEDF